MQLYAALSDAARWNPIARQIVSARHQSLSRNARTLALLNVALSDGGVAVMETKHHYNFWRPETAIAAAGAAGNHRTEPDLADYKGVVAPWNAWHALEVKCRELAVGLLAV